MFKQRTALFDDAKGLKPHIGHLWAFVATDSDGNEGLMAGMFGNVVAPLVAADDNRLDSLRVMAEAGAKASKRVVRLVKFTTRVEVEVFDGTTG
jgi:hypothetical protein